MFAKVAIVIVAAGLCASTLRAMRQARIQAAHELTAARLRAEDADEATRRLAIRIAALSTPEAIRHAAEGLGPMRTPEPSPAPAEFESVPSAPSTLTIPAGVAR